MTEEELLAFAKRILVQSGKYRKLRAEASLRQLHDILDVQGTDPKLVKLIRDMTDAMPELQDEADKKGKEGLTEEDVRTAARRKEGRLAREREMRSYGRC